MEEQRIISTNFPKWKLAISDLIALHGYYSTIASTGFGSEKIKKSNIKLREIELEIDEIQIT